MLQKDIGKILEMTFSSGSDVRIKVRFTSSQVFFTIVHVLLNHSIEQMQALQNMYEYLLDAESQMGTDASNNTVHYSVEGGQAVPVAAGAGDTNICGGIIQLYWDHILGRCLDLNEKVRQSALKVLGRFFFFPC